MAKKKSKFLNSIWLYLSVVFVVILTLFTMGIAAPFLISASDTFLVCVGFGLLIIYPILVGVWLKKFIAPQFKKVMR